MAAAPCWRRLKPASTRSATSAARISAWRTSSAFARRAAIVGTMGNAFFARIENNTNPGRLRRYPLAAGRGVSRAACAGGRRGPHGGPRICGLSAGVILSGAGAYHRAGRGVRQRLQPAGLLPWRYRADHVAFRPYRSRPAAAEFDPVGCGKRPLPSRSRAKACSEFFAWETEAASRFTSELHEPGDAPRLAAGFLSHRRAEGPMTLPPGGKVTRVELLDRRDGRPVPRRRRRPSNSPSLKLWTTK